MTDSAVGAPAPSIDLVQLLTPEGERVRHPDYAYDPDPQTLRSLYRDLVLVRRFDTEATALQRQGELGIWASLLGQEAAQIGSGRALLPQDYVFPTYREHGVAWCRGVDPVDAARPLPRRQHRRLGPEREQLPPLHDRHRRPDAARDRLRDGRPARRRGGTGDDGARHRRDRLLRRRRHRAGRRQRVVRLRAVYNAPVVFFCQNNQWAISEPNERQTPHPALPARRGFGFPGVRVDGNDVLAVHAVTRAALDRARRGEGPSFIEAFTYRMGAHTTSDDPTRYRIAAEVEEWKLKDPIARVKAYLARNGLADQAFFDDVEREADELAAHVRRPAEMPDPEPTRCSPRLRATRTPWSRRSGPGSPATTRASPTPAPRRCTEVRDEHDDDRQGHQRGPAGRHGGGPEGPDHGRGRRQARRCLPRHRRPAEGLRRGPRDRHPARRVRHHRHRHRARAARLPAGLRDPVRRVRLPRRTTRSCPSWRRWGTGRGGR